MPEWLATQLERDMNPSTPPWVTVRFYLGLAGLLISVAALILAVM